MRTISYSDARQSFSTTMNAVIKDRAPILITRQRGGNCVLLSQEDYEAMEETAYLLRSPVNARRLLQSVERIRNGENTIDMRIDDLEAMEGDADQIR
ncbi:MAG: YoeB-YefM toxin-antitoxin system antitoxin YefM [Azoarcus sp.]|jgi:antitoxin YefM|nr:YoeB-YefM toxin-antitoxin system antitoxin YefM [Azoarcus sp.]